MFLNILNQKNKIYILLLFVFSIIINYHYANRGVFPMDSFLHFDSAYRILNDEHPFKDFWVVSGPIVDYLQAFLFYLFGVNWQSYLLHSSLMNALLTISTFFVLKNFDLKLNYCFIYSLFFAVLAYPSSGTPFADHHAAFFSLLGIYTLILAIKKQKSIYWILLPLVLSFAFFSKSVPSSYVILSVLIILLLYTLTNKRFDYIKYLLISFSTLILIIFVFGKYNEIKLSSFLDQYVFYALSIGEERFKNLNFTASGLLGHFKFIYLAILPIFFLNIKKIFSFRYYIKHNDFYFFLSLLLLTFSLILHQVLTKNQTFIFFLIPVLTAFSHISLNNIEFKNKKIVILFFISICFFSTIKYHLRFNEDRKFHELENINFELSVDAKKIHKKLSGLKWISPLYKNNPQEEVDLINKIQSYLIKDSRDKMVITNYSFFSIILNQKLFSPIRAYAGDGSSQPVKSGKYKNEYKELMINLIKKNKITVIYVIYPVKNDIIYDYIDQSCFVETIAFEHLTSFELKNCVDIGT